MPSLTGYVIVSQSSPRVELYHRRDDGDWLFSWVEGLDRTLHVASLGIRVPLAEICRDVTFPPSPAETGGAPAEYGADDGRDAGPGGGNGDAVSG